MPWFTIIRSQFTLWNEIDQFQSKMHQNKRQFKSMCARAHYIWIPSEFPKNYTKKLCWEFSTKQEDRICFSLSLLLFLSSMNLWQNLLQYPIKMMSSKLIRALLHRTCIHAKTNKKHGSIQLICLIPCSSISKEPSNDSISMKLFHSSAWFHTKLACVCVCLCCNMCKMFTCFNYSNCSFFLTPLVRG